MTAAVSEYTASPPRMRISEVRLHKLSAPIGQPIGWSLNWTGERTVTLVEVVTDEGLAGWGDGGSYDELRRRPEVILGRSPFEFEAIFDELRVPPSLQPVRSGRVVWMLLCGISQVRRLASQCRNSSDGATELASSRIARLYTESTGRTWQAVWQKRRVPGSRRASGP